MNEPQSNGVEALAAAGLGSRVRVRGDEWRIALRTRYADCEAVRVAGCGVANPGVVRTLLAPFDVFAPLAAPRHLCVVGTRAWGRHVSRALRAAAPFGGLAAALTADIRLLAFQLEPALALLRHGRLRIFIADEVGLGKTIQAGVILGQLSSEVEALRALVVTPAGVREQWQHELETRFALPATVSDGAWLLERARDLPPDVNPWSLPGVYIASLDLVKRPEVLRGLEDVTWDIAIFDEAHGLGPRTARLAAAHALACSARRVVLMTATPPDGDPAHFDALAGLGASSPADAVTQFRRTRADAGAAVRRKSVLLPVRLSSTERRMHRLLERYTALVWTEAGIRQDVRARLATVILRKRALSSAASLALTVRRRLALLGNPPPPVGEQLLLPLHDEDPLEDGVRDDVIGANGLSDVVLERTCLEQIAAVAEEAASAESKLALLRRLLTRTREPMIVFTEYRDTLVQIQAAVAALRPCVLLHGGMTPRERAAVQRAFNRAGTLLLATDAASEGLNLHERCRLVVHFELPWTPARLEQRTGRVDRLGQARPVHELLLVARDTCERLVLAPLVRRARAAAVPGGRQSRLVALTESAVADVVMEGTVDEHNAAAEAIVTSSLDLSAEAACEAERLGVSRRLARHAGASAGRCGPDDIAITRETGVGGTAVVVVEAALEGADGRRIHTELAAVLVHLAWQRLPRSAAALRKLAADLLTTHTSAVFARVEAHCRPRLAEAARQHQRAMAAAAGREREITSSRPSAARRLVQVGLFDSRGANLLAARRRSATLAVLEREDRLANTTADPAPRTTMRVVAVRFGRGLAP